MERKVGTYDEGPVFYFGSDGARPLIMLHGLISARMNNHFGLISKHTILLIGTEVFLIRGYHMLQLHLKLVEL